MNVQAQPPAVTGVTPPPQPKTLADTGLSLVMMREILLKTMFRMNISLVSDLSRAICLPVPLTQELVDITRVNTEQLEAHRNHLRGVIKEFASETQSPWAVQILDNFDQYIGKFWLVKPKAASIASLLTSFRKRGENQDTSGRDS